MMRNDEEVRRRERNLAEIGGIRRIWVNLEEVRGIRWM